jgi:hypothetical protein
MEVTCTPGPLCAARAGGWWSPGCVGGIPQGRGRLVPGAPRRVPAACVDLSTALEGDLTRGSWPGLLPKIHRNMSEFVIQGCPVVLCLIQRSRGVCFFFEACTRSARVPREHGGGGALGEGGDPAGAGGCRHLVLPVGFRRRALCSCWPGEGF